MRGLLGKESQNRTLARKRQTERERERILKMMVLDYTNGMKGHLWKIESGCGNPRVVFN